MMRKNQPLKILAGFILAIFSQSFSLDCREKTEKAEALYLAGKQDSALSAFREAAASCPSHAKALFYLGKMQPQGDSAIFYYLESIKNGLDGIYLQEAQFRMGQFHFACQQYSLASRYFRDCIPLTDQRQWRWQGLSAWAFAERMNGEIASASVLYDTMLTLALSDMEKAEACEGSGDCALIKGDTLLAVSYFDSGFAYDESNSRIAEKLSALRPRSILETDIMQVPEPSKTPVFWIQTGAFSSKANAERSISDFFKKSTLEKPYQIRIETSGSFFLVQIGCFASESAAEAYASTKIKPLKSKYKIAKSS